MRERERETVYYIFTETTLDYSTTIITTEKPLA